MRETGDEERRTKLRLLLTPSELEKLDAAVQLTGTTRSLLILEAVKTGLADQNLNLTQQRRSARVDAWVTGGIKASLRQLATNLNVTQQHLTRHLLLTYLAHPPWTAKTQPDRQGQPSDGVVEVAS